MASDILKLTRLSYVPRWAIVPMLRQQSVAEHSYRVALICLALAESKNWSAGSIGGVVREAIIHDGDEIYTGDIPATAKFGLVNTTKAPLKYHNDVIPPIYGFIVKVADIVEAITWFKMYENCGPRRTSILGSMQQTLDGLKHHPHYDQDVYNRALALIESGEIE